jgi:hypothetical protein
MKNVCSLLKGTGSAVLALIAMVLLVPSASAQWTQSGSAVYPTTATSVGIGTTNPTPYTLLTVNPGNAFFGVKSANTGGGPSTALAGFIMDRGNVNSAASLNFRTGGVTDNWILGTGIYASGNDFQLGDGAAAKFTFTTAGNFGIGTAAPAAKLDVVGNVNVSGSITAASVIGAVYQDIAEWVPATTKVTPGTVVVLNPAVSNEVMPSSQAYDTGVAGVVSAQPGVILGRAGEGKAAIATTGRVKVMVDAKKTGIHVGDLLVTSDELGVAMRSEPMEINGRKFHQPGTVLGKALEPLASGRGEILVLLSLQ